MMDRSERENMGADPQLGGRWHAPAARGLGGLRRPGAMDSLIAALQDKEPRVRRSAAEALGKIGGPAAIAALIALLDNPDGLLVQRAHGALVEIGEPAVPVLIAELNTSDAGKRWEIVKALVEIGSPAAASALLRELQDEYAGIRWLAAQGLSRMGEEALVLLLGALIRHSDSAWLREGARHALQAMAHGSLADTLTPVIAALDDVEPILEAPIAANVALGALEPSLASQPPRQS